MRKGKLITIRCYGPIAVNKQYKSLWEDIWLSWTGKPGRTKYYLGPTLLSKTEAYNEYELNLDCKKHHPEIDWEDEIRKSQIAINSIEGDAIYIEDPADEIPNIYSPREYIDRVEAESMIAAIMKSKGFDKIRCKWVRPKLIIVPM